MKDQANTDIELFSFFSKTPDLVCIAGRDGYFKKVNPPVIEKFGYSEAELYERPIASFIHPEDQGITQQLRSELLTGKTLHNFLNRYITKDGRILWLEWTSIYFPDKEVVFAIAKDITERKQLEKEVEEQNKKYKSLATFFKGNIEKDRKYLAYELHEELAQLVSALKMDVEWVAANATDLPTSSMSRVEHAAVISKLLIKTLQRISFSISPNMLDDFGLNATLEWLCKEFSILNEIPCEFEAAYNEDDLDHEMKIDFFRICQEALTNVIDHANATKVNIRINEVENDIQLCIFDDGKGFYIDQEKKTPGLTSMRERAASINGRLELITEPGKGTRICASVARKPGGILSPEF